MVSDPRPRDDRDASQDLAKHHERACEARVALHTQAAEILEQPKELERLTKDTPAWVRRHAGEGGGEGGPGAGRGAQARWRGWARGWANKDRRERRG